MQKEPILGLYETCQFIPYVHQRDSDGFLPFWDSGVISKIKDIVAAAAIPSAPTKADANGIKKARSSVMDSTMAETAINMDDARIKERRRPK